MNHTYSRFDGPLERLVGAVVERDQRGRVLCLGAGVVGVHGDVQCGARHQVRVDRFRLCRYFDFTD